MATPIDWQLCLLNCYVNGWANAECIVKKTEVMRKTKIANRQGAGAKTNHVSV